MTMDLYLAAFAVVMTWVMVFSAGMLKSRAWTPAGMLVAFGNRHDVAEPTPLAARADRAGKNMLESLPLFLGLVAIAHLSGRADNRVILGAHLFFWARAAYWVIYLIGIPFARTAVWWVSIAGLAIIFSALV
jgi:uncharacterized MAPEG superfamily protein